MEATSTLTSSEEGAIERSPSYDTALRGIMIFHMNWKRVFSQRRDSKLTLLAGFLASSVLFSMASAQAAPQNARASKSRLPPPNQNRPRRTVPRADCANVGMPASARQYYQLTFGVDNLSIKSVESGSMLRFSYHVLNAAKAQALNDKKATPYLYDLKSRARLEVPSMEKVGQLRQSSPVQDGRTYWMVFANQQRLVKPGSRVDVVIGPFAHRDCS